MSTVDAIRATFGIARVELRHCWECDATFHAASFDACAYCESPEL